MGGVLALSTRQSRFDPRSDEDPVERFGDGENFEKGAKLIHSDLLQVMESMAMTWSLPSLLKRMETLHQTTLAIKANANTSLALEAMMLSWAEG